MQGGRERGGDDTWRRLQLWTKGQKEAERLVARILAADGYEFINGSRRRIGLRVQAPESHVNQRDSQRVNRKQSEKNTRPKLGRFEIKIGVSVKTIVKHVNRRRLRLRRGRLRTARAIGDSGMAVERLRWLVGIARAFGPLLRT